MNGPDGRGRGVAPFPGHLAIDLGTSSTSVTAFDPRQSAGSGLDAGQEKVLRQGLVALFATEPPDDLRAGWAGIRTRIRGTLMNVSSGDPGTAGRDLVTFLDRRVPDLVGQVCAAVEQALGECPPGLFRWLAVRLDECYSRAFRVPPIERLNLRPIPLNAARSPTRPRPVDDPGAVRLPELYRSLIGQAEKFLTEPDGIRRRISHLVVTVPASTPHRSREKLTALVRDRLELSTVHTVDELTSAAMFVLMREFGELTDLDVEAFRARCRRLTPSEWEYVLLIVHIGVGSTEAGLLSVALRDVADPSARPDYVLTPRMLATVGLPSHGGDLLTLRSFYWLKAAIIDAFTAPAGPDPAAPRLAAQVLGTEAVEPGWDVTESLNAALPTRWDRDSRKRRPAFEMLWRLAERAKRELGSGRDFTLAAKDLDAVAPLLARAGLARAATPARLTLAAHDFEKLARPVVREMVAIAGDIVDAVPGQQIDRIVLAGRTGQVPLVRAEMLDLIARMATGRDSGWADPITVTVEDRYANDMVSLGACWSEALRLRQHGSAQRHTLTVDMTAVPRRTLPCAFDQATLTGPVRIFDAATEFVAGPGGRPMLRDAWRPLVQDITIFRARGRYPVRQGSFQIERLARKEFVPDSDLTGLRGQLQVDANLDLYVNVCRGEPYFAGPGHLFGRVPTGTPDQLVVGDGRVRVFGPDDPEITLLTADGTTRTARLSRPLPPPAGHGWTLYFGAAIALRLDEPSPDVVVSLDDRGDLRAHHGMPDYVRARDLRECLQFPGRVLRCRMQSGSPDLNASEEAFSGEH